MKPDEPPECPECGCDLYYLHEDGHFVPSQAGKPVAQDEPDPWEELFGCLVNEKDHYRCPACGGMELVLRESGRWD